MKILVGSVFGIGNAILLTPMLQSLKMIGNIERLDVLVGSTNDDLGSSWFLRRCDCVDAIYIDSVVDVVEYDYAIMVIPYDGRWKNGINFFAKNVIDSRKRPDNSDTLGISSWKKHEVEYKMENARILGFTGDTPSLSSFCERKKIINKVFFGTGYKHDALEYWKIKHFGNENFSKLSNMFNMSGFISGFSGSIADMQKNINSIIENINHKRFNIFVDSYYDTSQMLSECCLYVGNDTGFMHAAASLNIPIVAIFNIENSHIKSHPWMNSDRYYLFKSYEKEVLVEDVFDVCMNLIKTQGNIELFV